MTVNICDYIEEKKKKVDEVLDKYLPGEDTFPRSIHKAMRYAVFPGGKRIRAILAIASAQACGGYITDVMSSACAIEIIHSYSLIHDDLPVGTMPNPMAEEKNNYLATNGGWRKKEHGDFLTVQGEKMWFPIIYKWYDEFLGDIKGTREEGGRIPIGEE